MQDGSSTLTAPSSQAPDPKWRARDDLEMLLLLGGGRAGDA
jgi:hypothetical protein